MRPLVLPILTAFACFTPSLASAGPCEPGYFSVDGQDPCTACDAGTYSDSQGATSCNECNPYTVSAAGASECVACGFRAYQPEAGSGTCVWRGDRSCWTVRDLGQPAPFSRMTEVPASDQFSTKPVSLLRASMFCGATSIESRTPGAHPESTMCCYKSDAAKPDAPVSIEWSSILGGTLQVRVLKRALVCDQCQGDTETEQTQQCWKVRDLKNPRFQAYDGLRVADEYSFDFLRVKRPSHVCAPASFDGSPNFDTNGHYCCFHVGKAFVSGPSEIVTDPAGAQLALGIEKRGILCEPCEVSTLP